MIRKLHILNESKESRTNNQEKMFPMAYFVSIRIKMYICIPNYIVTQIHKF